MTTTLRILPTVAAAATAAEGEGEEEEEEEEGEGEGKAEAAAAAMRMTRLRRTTMTTMTTVKGTAMTAYAPIETAAAAANWQPATGQPIPMSPLMVHLASTHVVVVVAVRWATTSDQFTTQKATASMLASMHTPMLTPTQTLTHIYLARNACSSNPCT